MTLNNGDLLSRSGGIERAKIEERHFTCDLDKILNGGEIFSEEESSGEEPKKKTKETLKQRKRRKAMEEIDKQRRRQKDESASQQHLLVSSSVVSQQSTDQNVDTGANLRRFPLAKMALFSGYSTVLRVTFVLSPLDFSVILDEMMGTIEEMSEKLDGCYKLDTNPIPDGELTPGLHCVVWDATAGKWARAILLSQLSPDQFSYVNVDDGTRGFVNHRAHIKNILPQFETPRLSYRCGLKKFENQSDSSCTWNENERFKERLFASDNRVVCHFFPRNMVNDRYYIDLFDLKGNQYNSVDNEQKEKIRESEVQLPNESDFLLHINGAQEELDLPSANEINEWDDTDLVDEYRKNHRISKFDCKVEAWLDAYEGPHESSNSKPEEETVGFTDSFPSLEDALEANHIIDGFSLRYPPGPDAPNIPTEMFFSHVSQPTLLC